MSTNYDQYDKKRIVKTEIVDGIPREVNLSIDDKLDLIIGLLEKMKS